MDGVHGSRFERVVGLRVYFSGRSFHSCCQGGLRQWHIFCVYGRRCSGVDARVGICMYQRSCAWGARNDEGLWCYLHIAGVAVFSVEGTSAMECRCTAHVTSVCLPQFSRLKLELVSKLKTGGWFVVLNCLLL